MFTQFGHFGTLEITKERSSVKFKMLLFAPEVPD